MQRWKKKGTLIVTVVLLLSVLSGVIFPQRAFAYGKTIDLGQGWEARVDKAANGSDSKPHVHVKKNGKPIGTENVDGTSSHKDDLSKVPKKIRDKVRAHPEYKKGQKDLQNMQKAKKQIQKEKLNVKSAAGIARAVAIIIATVGIGVLLYGMGPAAIPIILAV